MAAARTYEYHYTVSGTYSFPIDMLRYDRATPATETDSNRIQRMLEHPGQELVTIALVGSHEPTQGRWASFGWALGVKVDKRAKA